MMTEFAQLPNGDEGPHLVGPPIVDHLHYEPSIQAYVVSFIPSDDASPEPKESVTVPINSIDGRQIKVWLDEISRVLARYESIAYIIHGGGGDFTIGFSDQRHVMLGNAGGSGMASQHVYDGLQYIGHVAETVFRMKRLAHTGTDA